MFLDLQCRQFPNVSFLASVFLLLPAESFCEVPNMNIQTYLCSAKSKKKMCPSSGTICYQEGRNNILE